MKKQIIWLAKIVTIVGVVSIFMILMACSSPAATTTSSPPPTSTTSTTTTTTTTTTTASYTVNIATKSGLGNYLVDSKGMTLYYFTKDSVGKSNASAAVLANWPIFKATNFVVPSGLNSSDFGTITRDDGQMQATYKGWPLYNYIKDVAAGDTQGQGVGGIWFVIDPANFPPPVTSPTPTTVAYTVNIATKSGLGNYLVDSKGMTLYYFTKDSVGKSNASAAVLANWPIFNVSNFVVPAGLNSADFGTITRIDGQMQATYKGWPLYYYIKDVAAGDTQGQGVGGIWFVIDPANFPPPASSTTSTTTTTTTTRPSGGGGGY